MCTHTCCLAVFFSFFSLPPSFAPPSLFIGHFVLPGGQSIGQIKKNRWSVQFQTPNRPTHSQYWSLCPRWKIHAHGWPSNTGVSGWGLSNHSNRKSPVVPNVRGPGNNQTKSMIGFGDLRCRWRRCISTGMQGNILAGNKRSVRNSNPKIAEHVVRHVVEQLHNN